MVLCPACGKENPEGFSFCGYCASPLAGLPLAPVAGSGREERKTVTVLFCDLAGSTAAAESADPEEVWAQLAAYHSKLRSELEAFGGTVEKFIGDALMAVFGAPVAHEDDPERAVRAALRLLEALAELNAERGWGLQVRIGVHTGGVLAAQAAAVAHGEGLVFGDVVNTAARLQTSAPVGAIAVSAQTYQATAGLFTWQELEPVQVKGKTAPLVRWQPTAARAHPGASRGAELTGGYSTPLVGREAETAQLIAAFDQVATARVCQLVTVVAEAGVGKSRLIAELLSSLEDRPGPVLWRQGRCLPYGEGIAFWALGEIIKTHAGILESDSPEVAAAKLTAALPTEDPDTPWLITRLAPLVGAGGTPASQQESFTAWQRFLEHLAATGPVVLVFEDLHWADAALLAFLEHLATAVQGVPLLVIGTARPELIDRHPEWTAGVGNAERINLAPLSEADTAELVSLLLQQAALPAATLQVLLERAGGNPLFAEEYVRLLADRRTLGDQPAGTAGVPGEQDAPGQQSRQAGNGRPLGRPGRQAGTSDALGNQLPAALEVPDSLQALIAARLDTLPPEHKGLLADAAVVGKTFWDGAVAALAPGEGHPPEQVQASLAELARREFIRPAPTSSMAGQTEFAFWHALVREVAYAQLPHRARATRHQATAVWIQAQAGSRVEDLADVLAHHYLTALELVQTTGQRDTGGQLQDGSRRFLTLAGSRAMGLDVAQAEAHLARALALTPADHPQRAAQAERWAQTTLQQERLPETRQALEEALALYRAQGQPVAAGRVLTTLNDVLWRLGDPHMEQVLTEALALLETVAPGPELVAAYTARAGVRYITNAYAAAIAAADQALALADQLDLPEPVAALGYRGYSRAYLGQRAGLADVDAALALALAQDQSRPAARIYNNRAMARWQYDGPQAALEACREGIAFCQQRGITEYALTIAAFRTTVLAEAGQPAQALAEAGPLADQLEAADDVYFLEPRSVQLHLLAETGQAEQAPAPKELVARARASGQPQLNAGALTAAARLYLAQGQRQPASALLIELEQLPGTRADPYYVAALPELVRIALALPDPDLAARLVAGVEPLTPLAAHALAACQAQLAEATGDQAQAAGLYAEAAAGWAEFGNIPERAYALLGQGRCLATLGNAEATESLSQARDLFASLGYQPALTETRSLLERATVTAAATLPGAGSRHGR